MQLSRSDADTLLVLNRSQDNESSDQLTGILVSIKSVEQLQRLQVRFQLQLGYNIFINSSLI